MTKPGEARRWLDNHIANPPNTDDCVEWPFTRDGGGYGRVRVGENHRAVTHLTLEASVGPKPDDKDLAAHSCHNPPCVNERHLRWATHQENTDDKWGNGTQTLFTEEKILAIFEAPGTHREIAARFGCSREHVNNIKTGRSCSVITGKTWKHAWMSPERVLAIYRAEGSYSAVAAKYGTTKAQVGKIKRGLSRSSITGHK